MSPDNQLQLSLDHDLTSVPPGLPFKRLLAWLERRRSSWCKELTRWSLTSKSRDSDSTSRNLTNHILPRCQSVKPEHARYIWTKSKKPIKSQHIIGVRIISPGTYVAVLTSIRLVGILNVSQISRNVATAEQNLQRLVYSEIASLQLLGSGKEALDRFSHEMRFSFSWAKKKDQCILAKQVPICLESIMLQMVNSQQVIPCLPMVRH